MSTTKIIRAWQDLVGLESEHYKLEIDLDNGCGRIVPKVETEDSFMHTHYLSTHTFYGRHHEAATELLRECGFDVQLCSWDVTSTAADLAEAIDAFSALSTTCSQSMESYSKFRSCATDNEIGSARYTPTRSQRVKNKRRRKHR